MPSVVNGTRTKGPATSSNNNLLNTNTTTSFSTLNFENEFNFDIFPTSTWELESTSWGDARPDSRQSVTPVSTPTPRPPSAPAYSPVATNVAQSPLAAFVTQPSPTVPNPATPYGGGTFSFSPMAENSYPMEEQKPESKGNVMEEASSMMADSGRLRNLLTKPQNSNESASDAESRNKNRILKGLLNQQDEDESRNENRSSPRSVARSMSGPSEMGVKTSSAGGNNMLLQVSFCLFYFSKE